ncbi:MAG: hypothetical protein ACLQPH_15280 [Acidimicrobiales bacterium]
MPVLHWATHHRIWALGLGVAVVLAAVAAGVWFFMLRSPGTELDLRQALRLYRQDQRSARTEGDPRLPPPGVYRYRTSGDEVLSIGTFVRTFPTTTEMIVTDARCATVTWEPLEEHVEGLVECPLPDGAMVMPSTFSDEQIAGIATSEVIRCPSTTYFVPPGPTAGRRWYATCSTSGQRVRVAGQVLGTGSVTVAGRKVPALHTRLTLTFSGTESGTNPTDYWVTPTTGLVLREQETVRVTQPTGPLGSVRYTEKMAIALQSEDPNR